MREDLLPVTFDGKLDRFIEECSEAIKAICKLRRFGENPTDPLTGFEYNNIQDMLNEMQDVEHAIGEVRLHLLANRQTRARLSQTTKEDSQHGT